MIGNHQPEYIDKFMQRFGILLSLESQSCKLFCKYYLLT